ncbi:hypothetical protein ACFE04_005149 [Oxalis oulophora]
MAKLISKKKNIGGIVNFKDAVKKLQKTLSLGNKSSDHEEFDYYVPADVKEGHFAVIAAGGDEFKRVIVPLTCLGNPTFLSLLERAAEEYGFEHGGALTIPCQPSELERILSAEDWQQY